MILNTANVSNGTRMDYNYIVNSFIKSPIGHRKIKEITSNDIKTAMLLLNGKSASVYDKTVMLYKKIFADAVENNIIAKSPCTKLKSGGKRAKEKTALTKEQTNTLESALRGTHVHPFIILGLYAGLRREEILGLKWDCVFLEGAAPHLAVRRALRWDHNQPIVEEKLKSKASERDIPMPFG